MTWSYSGDPADSKKDEVRFLIQDTNPNEQLISDEELQFLITQNSNTLLAASYACNAIATAFSRFPDTQEGDISVNCSQIVEQYTEKAKYFRNRANLGTKICFENRTKENGRPSNPEFSLGQFDNRFTISRGSRH